MRLLQETVLQLEQLVEHEVIKRGRIEDIVLSTIDKGVMNNTIKAKDFSQFSREASLQET